MTPTITNPDTTPTSGRLGYQPALDGVRAIAITLVVLYHYPWGVRRYGLNPVHGAFLGVDAFFVLSGFLITTLLLQEHAMFGRVNIRRFYARRALRLLPAFGVLWLIALVLFITLQRGDPLRAQWIGLVGTFFYAGNWVRIVHPNSLGMLQQTWSLAIEEQFYLVWPAVLIFMLRRHLRLRSIAALTAAGALASAGYRAAYWGHAKSHANFAFYYFRTTSRPQPAYRFPGSSGQTFTLGMAEHLASVWDRVYYGSDTQADALLAGCFTAIVLFWLLPRLNSRACRRLTGLACLGLVGSALIVANAYSKFSNWLPLWGFLAFALSISVLIVGLVADPTSWLARFFALSPLVWLGRRSYAIYLFHELVYARLQRRHVNLPSPVSFVFQITAILVAAELSYRLVEAPMLRRKSRYAPETVAAGHGIVTAFDSTRDRRNNEHPD